MNDGREMQVLRGLGGAVFIGIATGFVVALLWMLVFTQFAIVPTTSPYPDGWTSLTSAAQVDWLREHTVILSGFSAMQHIATHFSEYAKHVYMIFGLSVLAALCAGLLSWHVHRDPQ